MKPLGINSKHFGCCPGHDKVPYKDEYETKRGRRDRKVKRKKKMTRHRKRAFKNSLKTLIKNEIN